MVLYRVGCGLLEGIGQQELMIEEGECCCSGAQLHYGWVINVSLLLSRCVKRPLAEEYSPPCPDRGTCNGSNGVVEGKALSKSAGSFSGI